MNATAASSPELQLLDGNSRDLDSVVEVMNAAFDERFGEAWTRSQCAGILPMPGVKLVVARFDGQTAGFSLSRIISDEAELLLLAVSPNLRRRGIGRMLLRAAESILADRGARVLVVTSGNQRADAHAFYEKNGYTFTGRRYRKSLAG